MRDINEFFSSYSTFDLKSKFKYSVLKVNFSHANGCGAKGGKKFPNSLLFVSIKAACNIHDIEWKLSTCYSDLLESNENFDNNLKKICDPQSNVVTRWIRRQMISYYISGVELVGTKNYAEERGFL